MSGPKNTPTPASDADQNPPKQAGSANAQPDGTPSTSSFRGKCQEIAEGIKILVEAGMGATVAGDLAAKIYGVKVD